MIRTVILMSLVSALAASGVVWAEEQGPTPPAQETFGSAPPPPGMDDPGVTTQAATATGNTPSPTGGHETLQPVMPDTSAVRPLASRKPTPEQIIATSDSVTERKQGNDTVKEYRKNGLLRMVHIIPQNGPEQMYHDHNGDGRLDRDALDGPVSPVYFSLYQWD
ncbi:DUF2782 domain-containing protein [Dokdonella sp.]|uniref:DUF2782 domain-containing protein n=1 Tax=Dokdonella sp. TaxID=2291710 RepID=UPI003C541A98